MGKSPVLTLVVIIVGLGAGIFIFWRQQQPPPPPAPVPDNVSKFSDPAPKQPARGRSSAAAAGRRGAASANGAALQPGIDVPATEKPDGAGPTSARSGAGGGRRGRASAPDINVISPRRTLFLSGSMSTWTRPDVDLTGPFRVQAGGRVEAGTDAAGPDGIGVGRARGGESQVLAGDLMIPSAPYLALIGRVCSPRECSAPFLIGTRTVLCPSLIGVEGALELWTNNRVRDGRSQTRSNYSGVTGGFHVYLEPAPATVCGKPSAGVAFVTEDGVELAAGRTLARPEFVISSSQSSWKPFFLPLDRPLRIQASGEVRPVKSADATGPEGIPVPDVPRWTYPGTQVVVDAEHPLFNGGAPYQALIGRVCGAAGCGPTFVVGRDRTVCAAAAYRDRLELWINHIIPPRGLLAQGTPLTMEAFDLQTRVGSYRFTVSSAAPGACGG